MNAPVPVSRRVLTLRAALGLAGLSLVSGLALGWAAFRPAGPVANAGAERLASAALRAETFRDAFLTGHRRTLATAVSSGYCTRNQAREEARAIAAALSPEPAEADRLYTLLVPY